MDKVIRVKNAGGKNELVALPQKIKSAMRPEIDLPLADVTIENGKRVYRWQAIPKILNGKIDGYARDVEGYDAIRESAVVEFVYASGFITATYVAVEDFEPFGHSFSDDGIVAEVGDATRYQVVVSFNRENKCWKVFTLSVSDENGDSVDYIACSNELATSIDDGMIVALDHLNATDRK